MKKFIFCLILTPLLVGCDNSVADFVTGVEPVHTVLPDGNQISDDLSHSFKVSPGHAALAAGSNYSASMTVTTTRKAVVGSTYRAELSINAQSK